MRNRLKFVIALTSCWIATSLCARRDQNRKKMKVKLSLAHCAGCILTSTLLASIAGSTQSLPFPASAPVQMKPPVLAGGNSSGPVQLPIMLAGTTDFALEFSDDLQHWQVARNYHVANAGLVTLPDFGTEEKNSRFYRLRIPGDLPADELSAWKGHGISSYRYHYEPRIGFCNCINSANVTVRNGVVASVTNAVRASGTPEPNPNPADFPTIETLFEQIKTAEQNPEVPWVGVRYDPVLNFPADMLLWTIPDLPHGFVASGFERLP